jgi:vacuolar-type H+-ATPase subunit E/Vma4
MKTIEENIQALTSAVLNEASVEAEAIVSEARIKAEAVRERAQEQAEAERNAILDKACQEAARLHSQAIATTQLQARTTQLERREQLLDGVFEEARKQLTTMQQWTDYQQIAQQLLREALVHLGSDAAQIRADARTRTFLTDEVLSAVSEELKIQVQHGEELSEGTGLIVQTIDGHRQYDNTLEARLGRLQNTLRAQVLSLLMGDKI